MQLDDQDKMTSEADGFDRNPLRTTETNDTMSGSSFDVAIVGGGIVGMATAYALMRKHTQLKLVVLEAETGLASHQTGHNSGVIHSGLYYKPGSLKAENCVRGREWLYQFCAEHKIPHERCGKLVVAVRPEELGRLEALEQRGTANGLQDLRRVSPEEMREIEPSVAGVGGLVVRETGIVDYVAVTQKLAELVEQLGAAVHRASPALQVRRLPQEHPKELVIQTPQGPVACRHLIGCAGLQSDRLAKLCGVQPGVKIIPFRGEYYDFVSSAQRLVKNLIYPVPDPAFPFLGVHFTRMIHGGVEAGPNAVLSFKRHGYSRFSFSLRDVWDMLSYRGFWRLSLTYWRIGLGELLRSASKALFLRSLRQLVPELQSSDIKPGGAGVRAQAVWPNGQLLDDFHIVSGPRMIHVLNAPSPAATAALSIGDLIAQRACQDFELS